MLATSAPSPMIAIMLSLAPVVGSVGGVVGVGGFTGTGGTVTVAVSQSSGEPGN